MMPTPLERLIAPLERAIAILRERSVQHGDHVQLHRRIAQLWSAYLGVWVEPHQVAACMVLYKLSRSEMNPELDDNVDDMAGNTPIYGDLLKIDRRARPSGGDASLSVPVGPENS